MVYSLNKSVNQYNKQSRKLYFNGELPDWGNGATTESDGRRVINLPPDDTMGYNFIKISTFLTVHTNYTMNIYSMPPSVQPTDMSVDGNGLYKVEDLGSTTINHINTDTPYYTELLTGNQYHYRIIPVMGEYSRIEFVFNGAYDPRADHTDRNVGHLYCKTMLSSDANGSILVDTLN